VGEIIIACLLNFPEIIREFYFFSK